MFSKVNGKWGITSFGLKVIGILLMVVDHIHEMFYYVGVPTAFTMVGRVVAPIFLFLAVEGYHYTHSKIKYLRNLLIGFWITNVVEMMLQKWLPNPHIVLINSIFGTIFLAVLTMWIYEGLLHPRTNKKTFYYSILGLIFLILPAVMMFSFIMSGNSLLAMVGVTIMNVVPTLATVEGGISFIILALFFHIFRKNRLLQIASLAVLSIITYMMGDHLQSLMVFSGLFMWFYNGEKGRKEKWFFYIFYPTHIAILYVAATLLFPN